MVNGGYAFPRARRRDPVTSKLAAAAVTTAGKHFSLIRDALLRHGPAGKDRIAQLTGLDAHQVARRLPEMRTMGLVGLTGETVQSRAGRAEREWAAMPLKEETAA